jgi:hypothetical protein
MALVYAKIHASRIYLMKISIRRIKTHEWAIRADFNKHARCETLTTATSSDTRCLQEYRRHTNHQTENFLHPLAFLIIPI